MKRRKLYYPITALQIAQENERVAELPRLKTVCLTPHLCIIHGGRKLRRYVRNMG